MNRIATVVLLDDEELAAAHRWARETKQSLYDLAGTFGQAGIRDQMRRYARVDDAQSAPDVGNEFSPEEELSLDSNGGA